MHWCNYFGLAGIALVARLPIAPHHQSTPFVVGVALHLLCDFVLQTSWMSTARMSDKRVLLLHSAVAGFIPLAAVGMVGGNPGIALAGGLMGFLTHLVIDGLNKFGLSFVLGLAVDQVLHIAVIGTVAVMVVLA